MFGPASGYLRALSALSEAGVSYVVVGVGGINFYARTPAEAFATLDLDALLAPNVENLRTALHVLADLGYDFEASGEPFLDVEDDAVLGAVVRNGATLNARHEADGEIDLLLSISGFSYSQLAAGATTFRVAEVEVQVGRLEQLLQSKEATGRPKDREFLRTFEARTRDDGGD